MRHPSIHRAAFTLLELVLVLAVMTIMAGAAVPLLRNFGEGKAVGNAADQVVALATWGRAQAIARGVNFRLNFDPSAGAYWLTRQSGPSYENVTPDNDGSAVRVNQYDDVGEEFGRRFTVPPGVTFTCNLPVQPDGTYITLRPTGRCDAGTVTFKDAGGKAVEVGALSSPELCHVLDADEQAQEAALQIPSPPSAAR